MKAPRILLSLLFSSLLLQAHALIPTDRKQRLTEHWEFIRQDMGSIWEVMRPITGAGKPETVPLWQKVTLPHCFNAEDAVDPDVNYYQGPGWYRTMLNIENPYTNGRTCLEFEGAGQKTEVYVYTTRIASHVGGYDEWKADITEAVEAFRRTPLCRERFGGKIPIAIRCDNSRDTELIPSDMSDFNLYGENGELLAVGYCYEAFGIIVNKALLAEAGYELSDITNFESLKAVAEDITARKDELGFAAFSSAGLESSSSWRFSGHLANMPLYYEFRDDGVTSQPATITGAYLDNFKAVWDLYINNSTCTPAELTTKTGDESEAEFGEGKAVFFQNGTWEYANLVDKFGMNPDDLAMIPIYCGVDGEENAGLCSGTENCWAVNAKADPEDIQATLDFMYWVVTSESGTKMMAEQFGPCPFKNAAEPENVFFSQANEYVANGNYTVTWAFNYTPNVDAWRAGVVAALTQYSVGGGSWDDVVTAFVNGWATQYNNQ